jgi:hypothetical protein
MDIGYGKRRQKQCRPIAKIGANAYSIHHGAVTRNMGWSSLMGSQKNPKKAKAANRDSVMDFIRVLLQTLLYTVCLNLKSGRHL